MPDTTFAEAISGSSPAPTEKLKDLVTSALRRSGCPPLQYLDVDVRDGHVYLSARLPTLFLTEYGVDMSAKL